MEEQKYQLELPPFDELVQLAKDNPDKFIQLKQKMCNEVIASASDSMQDRLKAQQSHLDLVLSRCKNPIHANIVLRRELYLQLAKFSQALLLTSPPNPPTDAAVIDFQCRKK
ncbi:hypothetical protein BCU68_02430 [Vibrio sp. 10N.286.49.B3]|uniref:DUF3135 domain-containing protein n=1 Tax=Vibrio sp. 10N.286.49.B3 TaxID=1880855 RepID=UPI000C8458AF|nr:DUF3135 domain-containing protein [Vibrio sp. 10N.286.49.B3]PMH46253.1 hypothetical protein BCU68_02430 [Vibrio sp. 10N.286.49.B3]